jgi:diacylglycerol kinase (ATP)
VPRVYVLANPNARSGRGARLIPPVIEALRPGGWQAELYQTRGPQDARHVIRRLVAEEAPAPVVVLGGDGTLHEVVNGLGDAGFPEGFPLVPLAFGTGNDFHRMLHGRPGVDGLLATLRHGQLRRFDVGHVRWDGGEHLFVNLLGVGIDVEVLRRREQYPRLPGLLQYGAALVSALGSFKPPSVSLAWQGGDGTEDRLDGPVLLAALTVGPTVGGGFVLAPGASPEDGLLDLFIARPMGVVQLMRHLPGVIRGTESRSAEIQRIQCTSVRLASSQGQPLFFELDGERMTQPSAWLQISLRRATLTVLDRPALDRQDRS